MAILNRLKAVLLVAGVSAMSIIGPIASAETGHVNAELTQLVRDLDTKVFDAYNQCDLDTFESYFSPEVEFYHDQGGASFDRDTVVSNTRKFICNKVHRELIPASLKVYPIKDYGAIEEGEHVFCQIKTGICEGVAKFVMVWKNSNGVWELTRVLSYGHRALRKNELSQR